MSFDLYLFNVKYYTKVEKLKRLLYLTTIRGIVFLIPICRNLHDDAFHHLKYVLVM